MRTDLNTKAIILQEAQKNLSQTIFDYTDDNKGIINAKTVIVYHNVPADVGQAQQVNIWTAVNQMSINAYKIKDYTTPA